MRRIVRLTESDLTRIVRRVIKEQEQIIDSRKVSEKLKNEILNKSVTLYKNQSQQKNDIVLNGKIVSVDIGGQSIPQIAIQLDPGGFIRYSCNERTFTLNNKNKVFNQLLLSAVKDEFCTAGKPKADFTSTGGDMGGMA